MDLTLLRGWLELDDPDWPPDHYTLLGLDLGQGDEATFEDRAVERMELLRTHQLRHQEEVTEGMNRLAQAMACLTDAAAKREYDVSLGLSPLEEETTLEPELPAPTRSEESVVLELIEDEPIVYEFSDDLEPPPEPERKRPRRRRDHVLVLTEDDLLPEEDVEPADRQADGLALRRDLYAEMAKLRRFARVWEPLGEFVTPPDKPLDQPGDARRFAEALWALGAELSKEPEGIGRPGSAGHRIGSLARHPLAAQAFRSFLPSQRQALAADWEAAARELAHKRRLIREELDSLLDRGWGRRVAKPMLRRFAKSPEWVLVPVGALALLVAASRG